MKEYKILHIEDSPSDADLVKRILEKAGLKFQYFIADNKEKFVLGLKEFNPDMILCDHSLPQFDSIQAFEIYQEINLEIPFLLVTGSVSEEYAVEMMRKGIDDYLLKDNLQRLPKAIENAYSKREKERLRKMAEEKLAQSELLLNKAQQIAHIGSLEVDLETRKEVWSQEIYRILGLLPEEVEPSKEMLLSFIHPEDVGFVRSNIEQARGELRDMSFFNRIIRKDGVIRHVYFESKYEFDKQRKPIKIHGIIQDITEKVIANQEKEFDQKNLSALINNTSNLMWSVDRNFNLITSNQAFDNVIKRLAGKSISKGSNVFPSNFDEEKLERFKKFYERAFLGETFTISENSDTNWVEISFYPICKETEVIGTACYSHDITERKHAERLISESEAKYRSFFENSMDAILITMTDGQILDANPAACLIFQMTEAEICKAGRYGIVDATDPQLKIFLEERSIKGKARGELTFVRKNGTKFPGEISSSVFEDISGRQKTSMIISDITEKKEAVKEILLKNEQLKNLTSHLQRVREEERTTISREIHDELGQQLTALKMDIDWIMHKQNNPDEKVVSKLNEMLQMSDTIINTIRRISSDLRPAIIDDLGLIAALEWKCNDFEEKMGIPCKFVSNIKERKFENDFGINTYRILQETLTNIGRHAAAKSVTVSVNENETELFLEIADDGKGISSENIQNGKTLGIIGMKERAILLGGKLTIEGTKNKGTCTKLILPLQNEYTNS